ncbi:AAA family ATPase [Streptacidiphilus monticola]|uniref:AAA family ATPase n=1 Tax=Streptacidiphilus monticola TaxID=2161674 RepID=A0ABW1FWZ6_9ACTN
MTVILVTGVMASGKSTVAQALAERLPRSVHLRGDAFRRMVVNGREAARPGAGEEALRQLTLRYRAAAATADLYAHEGWTVVVQDVVVGEQLDVFLGLVRTRPLHVVVLAPRPAVVAAREAARRAERGKIAYGSGWTVEAMDALLREHTPRRGLWLDSSELTVAQTVDSIVAAMTAGLTAVE